MTTNTISKELEIQIVLRWWDKLKYITGYGAPYIEDQRLWISDENGTEWSDSECVEVVINEYERIQKEEDVKYKQNLLDKKAKLMAELAEISEELGE